MNTRLRPIIYLRGYAGSQGGVEATVDDPFYGFNAGSTHVRVGDQGKPQFFAFESPLVRLMSDHGYEDVYEGGQAELTHLSHLLDSGRGSIWIYRYYDVASETFGRAGPSVRLEIEQAAEGLRELICDIREQLQAAPAGTVPDDKVNLIGHSTGGLIIRSLLQKIYPENNESGAEFITRCSPTPPRTAGSTSTSPAAACSHEAATH